MFVCHKFQCETLQDLEFVIIETILFLLKVIKSVFSPPGWVFPKQKDFDVWFKMYILMALSVVCELCSCLWFVSAVNFVPWTSNGGEPHRWSDFNTTSVRSVKKTKRNSRSEQELQEQYSSPSSSSSSISAPLLSAQCLLQGRNQETEISSAPAAV